MITADVAELGAELRDYLDRVRAGGQEIARLVPTTRPNAKDAAYDDLVARGPIIPSERDPSEEDLPLVTAAGGLLLRALLAERAEAR